LTDRVLPAGRLREPLSAARAADAVLTVETNEERLDALRDTLGVATIFRVRRELGAVRWMSDGAVVPPSQNLPIVAVAGIARPQRFFDDLTAAGWHLGGALSFRDHHRYATADIARIARAVHEAGAAAIVTTDKDAVRLEALAGALPFAVAPMTVDHRTSVVRRLARRSPSRRESRRAGPPPRRPRNAGPVKPRHRLEYVAVRAVIALVRVMHMSPWTRAARCSD